MHIQNLKDQRVDYDDHVDVFPFETGTYGGGTYQRVKAHSLQER